MKRLITTNTFSKFSAVNPTTVSAGKHCNFLRPHRLSHTARAFSMAAAQTPKIEVRPTSSPGLDKHGEPRFLENVKMFLSRAAEKTDIPPD